MKFKTRKSINPSLLLIGVFSAFAVSNPIPAKTDTPAQQIVPPQDPTQSITYWKPHTIDPGKDHAVARTQRIFSTLLRAWDLSRIEPSLYIVRSSAGPWAASLADGNILLSRAAIKACEDFGPQRAKHLLAFILSHELAHQRADDLWHQKFFRLVGAQTPDVRTKMLRGLSMGEQDLSDLEQREAQADHDGLVLMASVGYDPFQVIDKKDFFTQWVENIWQNSCSDIDASRAEHDACRQAQSRAYRARAQLETVAAQATLYELGVQAFIANKHTVARRYFKAYARDYPSRAVYTSLGLTHMANAIKTQQTLIDNGTLKQPRFFFPLMLDSTPQNSSIDSNSMSFQRRGIINDQLKQKLHKDITAAIEYFEKALRLEPNHKKTYQLVAMGYLLDNNTFMARGVMQGKYIPRFGTDTATQLLLAMTSAIEGHPDKAIQAFDRLVRATATNKELSSGMPEALQLYASHHNYAALAKFTGQPGKISKIWRGLANTAKERGNSLLFRLALNQLQPGKQDTLLVDYPNVANLRLGDTLAITKQRQKNHNKTDIWLEGERLVVNRHPNGAKFVIDANNKIISAWQEAGNAEILKGISMGDSADRPLKVLGIPTRHIHMPTGEYLAYDNYGFALHVVNNQVAGWFLYDPT